MGGTESLRVYLDAPSAGWTCVTLEHGTSTLRLVPSHVPYDSISDLVDALLSVLERRDAVVRWNDEPVEHEFHFAPGQFDDAALRVFRLDGQPHAAAERVLVFQFVGNHQAIVRAFWRALRDMESRQTREEYAQRWGQSFPERGLTELTRRLDQRPALARRGSGRARRL